MLKGIEHFGLVANDTPRLVKWLEENLNMKVIRTIANGTTFFMQAPCGSILEVYPAKRESDRNYDNFSAGWRHLAIEVDDFEVEYQKLIDKGIKIVGEPSVNDERKLVLFQDFEGNLYHYIWRRDPLK